MADYFIHFSCLLDVGTPANAARALDLYNALSEAGASEEPPSDGFLLSIQPEHGGSALWMRDDVTGERESPTGQDMTHGAESIVTEALRDLARWLYRQLEQEYEYQTADETVDEAIAANAYTFTDVGRRFG